MIYRCVYIDVPDPAFRTLDGKYRAGFLDPTTIWRYARAPEHDLAEDLVRRALVAGDECFAIRHGDTLAAYGWYSRAGSYHVSETLRLRFDPGWAAMYQGYTHPAYRGQRLHAIGMTMALAEYRARGAKGLVSVVESWNESSLKSCYRMGYRDFGTIYEIRLGRLFGLRRPRSAFLQRHVVYRTPGCYAFGFRLEARNPRAVERAELASVTAR